MGIIVASAFMLFSFRSYKIPVDQYGNKIIIDSLPKNFEIMDTIMYEKMVNGVVRKDTQIYIHMLDYKQYLANKDKYEITYDTIIDLNIDTYTETVKVVKSKQNLVYLDLIRKDIQKKEPNYDLIKIWKEKGSK